MIYIFDTSAFVEFIDHHSERSFPSLWRDFRELVNNGNIVSVKEAYKEIIAYAGRDACKRWAEENQEIFLLPSGEEGEFIKEIYGIKHFRMNIEKQKVLVGGYHCDPLVISKAKVLSGCVITQEKYKDNGAKIPNICDRFGVQYADFDGFMEKEGLSY